MDTPGLIDNTSQTEVHRLAQELRSSEEEVEKLYQEEYSRLARSARIGNYLHLLTFRAVWKRLRK